MKFRLLLVVVVIFAAISIALAITSYKLAKLEKQLPQPPAPVIPACYAPAVDWSIDKNSKVSPNSKCLAGFAASSATFQITSPNGSYQLIVPTCCPTP